MAVELIGGGAIAPPRLLAFELFDLFLAGFVGVKSVAGVEDAADPVDGSGAEAVAPAAEGLGEKFIARCEENDRSQGQTERN